MFRTHFLLNVVFTRRTKIEAREPEEYKPIFFWNWAVTDRKLLSLLSIQRYDRNANDTFLHVPSVAVIFEDISPTKPRFSLEGTVTSHWTCAPWTWNQAALLPRYYFNWQIEGLKYRLKDRCPSAVVSNTFLQHSLSLCLRGISHQNDSPLG